jgi:hypothetical protein
MGDFLFDLFLFLWPVSGLLLHIHTCNQAKTWCGTPIWEEPTTYVVAFLAMIMGPVYLLVIYLAEPTQGD